MLKFQNTTYFKLLLFLIILFFSFFFFPKSDEPDWLLKSKKVLNNADHYSPLLNRNINIYNILPPSLKNVYNLNNINCVIEKKPYSFYNKINIQCINSYSEIFKRFLIALFSSLPILFFFIFYKKIYYFINSINKLSLSIYKRDKEIIGLSILFPSVIYYLGILSNEAFVLSLSLLLFVFRFDNLILSLLIFSILLIDVGSAIICASYFILIKLFLFFFNNKKIYNIIFFLLIFLIIVFFFRKYFITFLDFIPILSSWSKEINIYMELSQLDKKYPIILRPIITYFGLIFMLPSMTKVIILYCIFTFFLLLYFNKSFKFFYGKRLVCNKIDKSSENFILFFLSLFFILCLIFLYPVLAFAKYFIFLIPFFLNSIIDFYKISKICLLLIISNLIIFTHLLIFRLI
jgi:hypothetical protein